MSDAQTFDPLQFANEILNTTAEALEGMAANLREAQALLNATKPPEPQSLKVVAIERGRELKD